MAFFKPGSDGTPSESMARLHAVIWVLIYGGLLTLVLGLSVQRTDDALGWALVVIGALAAAVGLVLIYVRSRIKSDP